MGKKHSEDSHYKKNTRQRLYVKLKNARKNPFIIKINMEIDKLNGGAESI